MPSAPLGLGPIVSIATQSGVNQWRGSVAGAYAAAAVEQRQRAGGQTLTVETRQGDFFIGGPLNRDRWWLFGSLRVARNRTGNPRSTTQLSYLRALDPGFSQASNVWRGQFGFAKVTGRLFQDTQVLASCTRDVLTLGGAQPNEAGNFRDIKLGGPGYFARVSSVLGSSLSLRVSAGYNGKKQELVNLQPAQTGIQVYQGAFDAGGFLVGSGLLGALQASSFPGTDFRTHMLTLAGDLTYLPQRRVGFPRGAGGTVPPAGSTRRAGHGLQQQRLPARRVRAPRSEQAVGWNRAVPPPDLRRRRDYVAERRRTRLCGLRAGRLAAGSPRVTLNAGVRVDFVRRIDRILDTPTQRSTEIGPRLGINYAIHDDRRDILRASWSRVHENLSANETQAGTNLAGVTDSYDTSGDGSFATVFVQPTSDAVSSNVVVDLDHYHQGHVDEIAVGYQRQFASRTSLDVSLLRRAYRDRPAAVEVNGLYDRGVFLGYADPSQNEIYRLTANVWNWPVVNALQVQVAHRSGPVQLLGGYTRQWNHMAGTWQPNDPASFIQPDAFPNTNGIGFVDGCTTPFCDDPNSYFTLGGGRWHHHLANAAVVWDGPWRLRMATNYKFQSGPWSGPMLTLDAIDPAFGLPVVTLPTGRVVANPLATPVRFASRPAGTGSSTSMRCSCGTSASAAASPPGPPTSKSPSTS